MHRNITSHARLLNLLANPRDFEVLVLGQLGFSVDFISKTVKLTPGQVYYRLKRFGIHVSDYRNGRTEISRAIVHRSKAFSALTYVRSVENKTRTKLLHDGWTDKLLK